MFRNVILFLLVFTTGICRAQETVEQTDKLAPGLTAKYHVLKSDYNIKQGLYQVIYKRNIAVATGNYKNNVKVGNWHFYDPAGKLVQHYNYDDKRLTYESPKDPKSYDIQYSFDIANLKKTDTVTRPVKVGGIFYGYLPYLNAFRISHENRYDPENYYGIMRLLISPAGRLAECKLFIKGKLTGAIVDTYVITDDLLTEEDKSFIPATYNRENVSATILIGCKILPNWRVSIYNGL